ncbi:hypothetical protein ACFV2X_38120 [Streptomyces sp. NPDC059679]|uniref:hypothetical protein n=1 Tax=Streptomyces sp. NPDC059679 TaxID=3346903 RepID=UPI0036CE866B
MNPTPHTPPTSLPPADVDPSRIAHALDDRIVTSADVLYARITAGLLEVVGRPTLLPAALFPDVDAQQVQAIWDLALTVGYLCGTRAAESRRWDADRLAAARNQLAEAGYGAMADRIGRVLPQRPLVAHPADGEARLEAVRGGRS